MSDTASFIPENEKCPFCGMGLGSAGGKVHAVATGEYHECVEPDGSDRTYAVCRWRHSDCGFTDLDFAVLETVVKTARFSTL